MAPPKNPPTTTTTTTTATGIKIIKSIEDPPPPPKDHYAKYKTTTRAYLSRESLIKERIITFFNLDNHTSSIAAILGRSPMLGGGGLPIISEHAKFCTESWWMRKVEGVFEEWLGLLKCDICGMGVEEIYKGLVKEVDVIADATMEDPFVDMQTGAGTANQMDIDLIQQLQRTTPPLTPTKALTNPNTSSPSHTTFISPTQNLDQEYPTEASHQKYFNEDPWELLVGSKNVLMDTKPWELTQEFLDEIRRRWNQGSELFLFEEGMHLRRYEDCDGFADEVWVWI